MAKTEIGRYRSATEWQTLGVNIQHSSGDLPRAERETTITFINAETTAQVDTAEQSWMRRLERDGARPHAIQVFDRGDGENRSYTCPKSWIKIPYRSQRVAKPGAVGLPR